MQKHLEPRRYVARFESQNLPHVFCDVLVIGSGVAGLSAAIKASEHAKVLVVAKDVVTETNTGYAQGGHSSRACPRRQSGVPRGRHAGSGAGPL